MPTFHPAYLLRSPQEKVKVWEDLQSVMKKLRLGNGKPIIAALGAASFVAYAELTGLGGPWLGAVT